MNEVNKKFIVVIAVAATALSIADGWAHGPPG